MNRLRILVLCVLVSATNTTQTSWAAAIFNGSTVVSKIEDALRDRVFAEQQRATMRINMNVAGLLYHFPTITQVSISDLAHDFGFSHFNWISQIIGAPPSWVWYKDPTLSQILPSPSALNPYFDPNTNPLSKWSVRFPESSQHPLYFQPVVPDDGVVFDTHPAYYNEAGYGGTPDPEWNDNAIHSSPDGPPFSILCDGGFSQCGGVGGRHFLFIDRPTVGEPSNGESLYRPGEYLQFKTSLAGIRSDGTYQTWDGIGTTFYWKTNAVAASDVLNIKAVDNTHPIISGGIFEVVSDQAPEPASQVVLLCGIAALIMYNRRIIF